jgi:hypothetical protein
MLNVLAALALVFSALAPAASSPLEPLLSSIRSEVQTERAMTSMRAIHSSDRWFTFPKFQETAEYLARTMRAAGLERVEIIQAPADGITQVGFWTMPLAWDVTRGTLEITSPVVAGDQRMLADYEKVPASLGMWSGPTPPEGLTAEIIEIKERSPAEIDKLDLAGKLVLMSQNPANLKWLLARKRAAGAINAFSENTELRDGRQWINAWGDNGWAFTKQSTPLLSFSISPRQAEFLRKLLAAGPVRATARVNSRYYSGGYPYVTGVIPGADTAEEVLTLGHTAEQGAHDNATGVAAMLEAMTVLNTLVRAGKLERPRRTIRILAMPELYASMHYIAQNQERIRNTVAAFCLDTPAAPYQMAGTEYTFHLNPGAGKSWVDAFILRLAATYFSRSRQARPWNWKPYTTGTDNYLGDPSIGVPTVWPYSGTGVHSHHNSADTPDTVDPRSLRDLAVIDAAFLYYVASAGSAEARWLGEVALSRAIAQITGAADIALERAAAADAASLARVESDGVETVSHAAQIERNAVVSAERLAQPAGRSRVRADLGELAQKLDTFTRGQLDRVQAAFARRSGELGVTRSTPPAAGAQLATASGLVVRRKRFGTIPLDEISPDQREGYPSGAWSLVPITALYWCDGRRDLAEVMRLTRLETGDANFDIVGYFRFLARRGYVELVER